MGDRQSHLGPVLCVVGARPNFMKMAPILRAFGLHAGLPPAILVHTGQHYDAGMSERFFRDLDLPLPHVNLEVGSGSQAQQTADVMKRFEPVMDSYMPSCVLVVGDVNSTLACSLVAAKKRVPVVHVEAGLRSYDRGMPEEINRIVTDQLADVLYTTERAASENLAREGIPLERVVFVGNVMIDSLLSARAKATHPEHVLRSAGCELPPRGDGFGLVTLHRPSNVDDPQTLEQVLSILVEVSRRLRLIWPVHPRALKNIQRFGLARKLSGERVVLLPPAGYLEMIGLMDAAKLVLTDSGGVQEETTALSVPCLTMRQNTERPITVEQGTNTLVGRDGRRILNLVGEILATGGKRGRVPELWDGKAADRIAQHLAGWLAVNRIGAEA